MTDTQGTGIVLAGGRSTRMGMDKRYIRLRGETLLSRAVGVLRQVFPKVFVVGDPDSPPDVPQGVDVIEDQLRAMGPLGGVHAALTSCSTEYAFVAACDMPFLNAALIRHLLEVASGSDAAVPCAEGMLQPLHAVYGVHCAQRIRDFLETGQRRAADMLKSLSVRYVEEDDVRRFDPDALSFFNINTPDDLSRAEAEAARREN